MHPLRAKPLLLSLVLFTFAVAGAVGVVVDVFSCVWFRHFLFVLLVILLRTLCFRFVHTVFAFAIAESCLNGISTFMNDMLIPCGFTLDFVSFMGSAFVVAALVGSSLAGYVLYRPHHPFQEARGFPEMFTRIRLTLLCHVFCSFAALHFVHRFFATCSSTATATWLIVGSCSRPP
jgi:hypothetical protein